MQRTRVVALTPGGAKLARELCQKMAGAECWLPRARVGDSGAHPFDRLAKVFGEAFAHKENLVCIMATGIVVRHLAPFLRGKDRDPAVVVLDEGGRFAISLLSGHLGGANDLARQVAAALGGTPVITTATDVRDLPSLDVLAQKAGLIVENPSAVREVSMALLSGRQVRLVDPEACLTPHLSGYETCFQLEPHLPDELASIPPPAVYVGIQERKWPSGWLRLRPPCLVAGVGCHHGTSAREVVEFIQKVFRQAGLSLKSLKALATISRRKDAPGLREAARQLKVELRWFTAEELAPLPVPHPSPQAARHLGVASVSEAAALRATRGELLVPKKKSVNVTVAVARDILPS
jgi:cobalt-precorrin 5A hydrolase